MKTLYCNGISDVQITKETKKNSKRVGTATIEAVFSAKSSGDLMVIKTLTGNVGIKKTEWDRFMAIHNTDANILKSELQQVPAI